MPSPARTALLTTLAAAVLHTRQSRSPGVTRVGIDGVDGAGKTCLADELAGVLQAQGAPVIRASVDGFHRPRAQRYRQGRYSPQGFYDDSYDYAALRRLLLEPLSPGGSGRYVTAAWDLHTDRPVTPAPQQAPAGAILLVDGIFVHRPALRLWWDFSVWLEVDFAHAIPRLGARDGGPVDVNDPLNQRYIQGQQQYLAQCAPATLASVVVGQQDWEAPHILRWNAPHKP